MSNVRERLPIAAFVVAGLVAVVALAAGALNGGALFVIVMLLLAAGALTWA